VVQQQTCHHCYGNTLDAFKIVQLSMSEKYSELLDESFRRSIRAKENLGQWNSQRSHHISIKEVHISPAQHTKLYAAVLDGNDTPDYYGGVKFNR
jgi:hypothetical protein